MCSKTTKATRGITVKATGETGAILADIRVGKQVDTYYVGKVPADFGRGYLFSKTTGDKACYAVNVEDDGATCECKGFYGHGHCKHIDATIALRNLGKI